MFRVCKWHHFFLRWLKVFPWKSFPMCLGKQIIKCCFPSVITCWNSNNLLSGLWYSNFGRVIFNACLWTILGIGTKNTFILKNILTMENTYCMGTKAKSNSTEGSQGLGTTGHQKLGLGYLRSQLLWERTNLLVITDWSIPGNRIFLFDKFRIKRLVCT